MPSPDLSRQARPSGGKAGTVDDVCRRDPRSTGFKTARLLLTVGSLEQSPDHVTVPHGYSREQAIEQVRAAKMIDNARAAAREIDCALAILEGETHASAPAASIGRALGFLLAQDPTDLAEGFAAA